MELKNGQWVDVINAAKNGPVYSVRQAKHPQKRQQGYQLPVDVPRMARAFVAERVRK